MYGLDEDSLIANKGIISEEQQKLNLKELRKRDIDLPFDIDMVDPECHACVLTQLKKYDKFVDDEGNAARGKFIVPCEGIVTSKIFNEDMKAGFTDEQWDELKAQADIVHWAKKYLKLPSKEAWVARWYQEKILRCSSRRKVLRISRRSGKCLSEDSKILTSAGRIKAKDFYNLEHKPHIVAFNEETCNTEMAAATIVKNGIKEVFELKTKNGRETTVTSNHPFLIQTDEELALWKEVKDISIGDKIAVPSGYSHVSNLGWVDPVGERKSRLLGYLTGDGGTSHKITTRFTNFDKEIVEDIEDIVSDYNCELNEIAEGNYNIVGSGDSYRKRDRNTVNKIVNNEGLRSLAKNKVLPKSIENANKLEVANFLGAYWDCDGWVSIAKKLSKGRKHLKIEIGACSASKELMLDIKHLLLRFDINSNLVEKRVKYNGGINLAWQLTITSREEIMKFCDAIPLRAKKERLKEAYELIKDRKSNVTYKEDYFWDTVKHVIPVGEQETYDLTVPTHHTLVADDIISHNTDMVCVEICYYLFTRPNLKIVVAGPQKTHTEEIVNRVRGFIKSNPELSSCVTKDISAPYYKLHISNKSELRGFAAGGRGKGGDGSSIRGQDADFLYLEEMDYIAEDSITGAVLPLLQTSEGTYLVGFSTPSGMQTPYYNFCEKTPNCKEFHHSYKVLPHFKAVEADRGSFTEEKWTHEFLAQWGSSDSGVYRPEYIDAASQMYAYTDHKPTPGWKYCVGTDWNEKHGTEIAVIGWNPFQGRFIVVDTQHIEASQFTQLKGVEKLLEVNKRWKPEFIYIDAGNGCLHKDSLVYTEEGVKRIENVSTNDRVLSHNGLFRDVVGAVSTGTKDSYLLKSAFCLPTKVSKSHRHIVYRSKNKFNDFDNLIEHSNFCSSDVAFNEFKTFELDKDRDFFIIPKQDISNSRTSYVVDLVEELEGVPNLEYDDVNVWTKHSFSCDQELPIRTLIERYKTSRATIQRAKRKLKADIKLSPSEVRLDKDVSKDYGPNWYKTTVHKKIPRYIDILDSDFLNLYGWYLSEGYAGPNNIEICQMPFHYEKEFNNLIDYCKTKWDCNVLMKPNGMRRLFVLSSLLTQFFKKIGGSKCYNKFIDKRILDNNGHQLLPSLFWGDGHEHKHGVNISLTSETLIMQTRQMLINNGILAGLHSIASRKRNDGYKDSRPQLMLYLNANKKNVNKINNILKSNIVARNGIYRRKYIELDDCFFVPIKKIDSIGKIDDMYDLTIDEDSSFCVNGFATHNSTNHELLMKTALKARGVDPITANLLKSLKKYDSGAAIETRDPVTKKKVRKPAKAFMINASVRMFEQGRIHTSANDITLDKQLRNYIIERYTPTGNPVYGLNEAKVGDHRLDAVNLAIVAFHLEFDELHRNTNISTQVAAVADPRSLKPQSFRGHDSIEEHSPQERRLEPVNPNPILESLEAVGAPAKIDKTFNIKTNRVGWATDEEDKFLAQAMQRRRGRQGFQNNRPSRSTF